MEEKQPRCAPTHGNFRITENLKVYVWLPLSSSCDRLPGKAGLRGLGLLCIYDGFRLLGEVKEPVLASPDIRMLWSKGLHLSLCTAAPTHLEFAPHN